MTRFVWYELMADAVDPAVAFYSEETYGRLDTAFQFTTPGMLTKLQALRSSKNVLFVIATNFEERIDSAIKRTGRIDRKVLVLPPDLQTRARIFESAWRQRWPESERSRIQSLSNEHCRNLALATPLYTWADIEGVVRDAERVERADDACAALQAAVSRSTPSIALSLYENRFESDRLFFDADTKRHRNLAFTTIREVLSVVGLRLEGQDANVRQKLSKQLRSVLKPFCYSEQKTDVERVLSEWSDQDLAKVIADLLEEQRA